MPDYILWIISKLAAEAKSGMKVKETSHDA